MEIHMPRRRENGKYSCNGCGIQVDFSELRCCETCGYFYCPSCQVKHKCRITEEGVVEILPFDPFGYKNKGNDDDLFEEIPTVQDVVFFDPKKNGSNSGMTHTVERVFCWKCGDVLVRSVAHLCPKCGKYFCDECIDKHICNQEVVQRGYEKLDDRELEWEEIGRLEQEIKNRERAKEPEKYSKCNNCGDYFPKDEMTICQTCGFVLCPSCSGRHVCNPVDVQKYREMLETIRTEQERLCQIEQEKLNFERAKEPTKYSQCDGCGNYFFKHELKKCTSCGAVLCPLCRESHTHSIFDHLRKKKKR